jgi:dienelactone hydrolase
VGKDQHAPTFGGVGEVPLELTYISGADAAVLAQAHVFSVGARASTTEAPSAADIKGGVENNQEPATVSRPDLHRPVACHGRIGIVGHDHDQIAGSAIIANDPAKVSAFHAGTVGQEPRHDLQELRGTWAAAPRRTGRRSVKYPVNPWHLDQRCGFIHQHTGDELEISLAQTAGEAVGPGAARGPGASKYAHLGTFSDWVEFARGQSATYPRQKGATLTPALVRDVLGFADDQLPIEPRVDGTWSRDGLAGEALSWSVGYGPRTRAWLLRPAHERGPLPAVLALHDHSGFKFFGKEKIADGPGPVEPLVVDLRSQEYDGRAFANELARQGFTVLVHDVFLWGSRRFDLDQMLASPDRPVPEWLEPGADVQPPLAHASCAAADRIKIYNQVAVQHEHVIAKYCALLGTSLAGVVAHEDRVALEYLKSRPDVVNGRFGCIGLSGGGCRAALLQATSVDISVSVIVDMMSTYDQLLDRHVAPHTWMFFPPGLARLGDWPDLAACRAPSPLVVQYSRDDHLFRLEGMLAAHQRIAESYAAAGAAEAYVGQFFDGPHSFGRAMQAAASAQLVRWLRT